MSPFRRSIIIRAIDCRARHCSSRCVVISSGGPIIGSQMPVVLTLKKYCHGTCWFICPIKLRKAMQKQRLTRDLKFADVTSLSEHFDDSEENKSALFNATFCLRYCTETRTRIACSYPPVAPPTGPNPIFGLFDSLLPMEHKNFPFSFFFFYSPVLRPCSAKVAPFLPTIEKQTFSTAPNFIRQNRQTTDDGSPFPFSSLFVDIFIYKYTNKV